MSKQAHYAIDKSFNDSSKVKEIKSENRYRKVNDEKYAQLEQELNKVDTEPSNEGGDPQDISQQPTNDSAPSSKDGKAVNWEKRYADLRSYQTKKEQELQASIRELQVKLEQKGTEVKYPKTEEEVNEWMQKYPEVYGIIKTIASKTSEEQTVKLAKDVEELNKERAKIAYQRAYNQLLDFHPDFEEMRQTDDFNSWLYDQPVVLQNAIFKPTLDEMGVKAASRVIDLYKKDKGLDKNTPSKSNNDAAKRVVKSSNEDPEKNDANAGKPRWSESRVKALSTKEFERHMDEIIAAQREGKFDYDLTGAAR